MADLYKLFIGYLIKQAQGGSTEDARYLFKIALNCSRKGVPLREPLKSYIENIFEDLSNGISPKKATNLLERRGYYSAKKSALSVEDRNYKIAREFRRLAKTRKYDKTFTQQMLAEEMLKQFNLGLRDCQIIAKKFKDILDLEDELLKETSKM